ncbi:methylmalonyl-CoA mutase family protein [Roseisolibacter sp. H3M3-2]|uniref:acyl-CoA mutase large subunit family protein n=1 Tax=Roseisolibacter sp. H3M3-2 TaxID=3031323 RepID=UPI0023D97BF7|nr:methylmalonyl-CoA mutase family protein [Roseisolibacter sp. H3M3-2]MDF1503827.1 methylmalonyl-CoA mutase family protein [Roseisolibacter sp. H3M3-2]
MTPSVAKPATDERFSPSDIPVPVVVRPEDGAVDYARDLGDPGRFPFTRGVQPTMYRGRHWTMRQYAGFGTASQTNARFKLLLAAGQTGISTAFDLPTQMGIDSDSPRALGEVGRVGVAIDTVEDMHALLADLPLDRVSTSMTINATAAILLAMYVVVAEERGIPRAKLSGTVQNDVLKEYIARGTYIYPPEPSLALIAEMFRFCAEEVPQWNPISISGYHIREAGATAVQELAFTFANAMEYVRRAVAAGLPVDAFAPRLSFFFAAHNDLFEEVAKFRAARRLYARLMRERFGADDSSARLRFHTQTGGVTLQAQQPLNNVVRVTIQALSAVLGGTQSLHTNGYDEALALPTAEAATLALRTQQVVAYESGATQTVDPLAGSYYVEALTTELETRARALLEEVDAIGGAPEAIARGFFQEEIARSAYEYQLRVERGDAVVVGVNRFADGEDPPVIPAPDFSALERDQVTRLAEVRRTRDGAAVERTVAALRDAARPYADAGAARAPLGGLMEAAVRARALVGEISDALAEVWGRYRPVA